jgi:hypothetical protein
MFRKRLIKQMAFSCRFRFSLHHADLPATRSGPDAGLLRVLFFSPWPSPRFLIVARANIWRSKSREFPGLFRCPDSRRIHFLNGKLDPPKPVYVSERVEGKFLMKGLVRGTRRLVVQSWRPGQRLERLQVDSDDFDRFHVGDRIEVAVQPGVLGIPWIYGVYREGRPAQ